MCHVAALIGISAITGMASGMAQYSAAQQAADTQNTANAWNAAQAKINGDYAMEQAEDALDQGDKEAAKERMKTAQKIGTDQAGFAAAGVTLGQGSALDTAVEDSRWGEYNAQTTLENYWRQGESYRMKANNYYLQENAYKSQNQSTPGVLSYLIGGVTPAISQTASWMI